MKPQKLLVAAVLAASSCYGTSVSIHAGPGGAFQSTSAEIRGQRVIVEAVSGRLYVDGIDYGRIREGDSIEVDTGGNVYVNGASRFR